MSADLSPKRVDELAEALVRHRLHASMNICTGCDWRAAPGAGSLADQHETHRAHTVAPLVARWVTEARGEALREFAGKWADWIAEGAPQVRGGAAYRAICEAQRIEAALVTVRDESEA